LPAPTTGQVTTSTTTAVEPYPTDEPLAGLPGHEGGAAKNPLPGMQEESSKPVTSTLLDALAQSGTATTLNADAQAALQKRISSTKLALDRAVYQFKDYRGKALEDMKQLQTQKTYGVMARIYAVAAGFST